MLSTKGDANGCCQKEHMGFEYYQGETLMSEKKLRIHFKINKDFI
jgi:hypothetical protein